MFENIDIENASFLVTGGTGFFGQAFVKKLIELGCKGRIVIYSRGEHGQHDMGLTEPFVSHPGLRFFIGDVRDRERLSMAARGVDYIIHAAALKHVPVAEYNPMECIRTNVNGAENVVFAAMDNMVKRVIALSTDKACSPINLYGASKLASDKIFVAANNLSGDLNTRYSVARYGNVIGSKGSVLPLFKKLIAEGATSMPITDERMTRFWISLDRGVDFVLSSLDVMIGGEIFVPKIPSMKMTDLAKGLAPDLPFRNIGIRPGEKLHEVMISVDDGIQTLDFGDYFVIEPTLSFWKRDKWNEGDYSKVPEGFYYASDTNTEWLSVENMLALSDGGLA